MAGIKFSETLTGFFLEDTSDFKRGYEVGKKRGNRIEIRVTNSAEDLDGFINDPSHQAKLEGVIDYGNQGKNLPTRNGVFNLFKLDQEAGMRKLIYSFEFSSESGEPYLFYGEKQVHKDAGFLMLAQDIKDDMTALFTTIYHGNTKERPAGAGILKFNLRIKRIVELFGSAAVTDTQDLIEKKDAAIKFVKFVNREIEETYDSPGIDLFDVLKLLELV